FFSSRRRHTRFSRDWSSDVCSSDLFMLWAEMPQGFDSQKLNRALLPHKIQIAPGSIFSAAGKYRNCIRLNYAEPPSDVIEAAVKIGRASCRERVQVSVNGGTRERKE